MDVPKLSITVSHDYQIIDYKLFKYDAIIAFIIGEANIPKQVIVLILNKSNMIASFLAFDSLRIIIDSLILSSSKIIVILLILGMLE